MLIDVGRIIADKYELVRLLGRGSAGEVWSACHQTLHEPVAIKILVQPGTQAAGGAAPEEDGEDASVGVARFRFEAQTAARLSRKTRHIVRVMDYGEQDRLAYLVMELLEGRTLGLTLGQDRGSGNRPSQGGDATRETVPLAQAAHIVSQIARALGVAHGEAVAHRDLKPANIFL
ncbi:MAG: protein kinase domain-containing protein, partial [Polyangiaceae bacterium]